MGIDIIKNWREKFLSTPSARRATSCQRHFAPAYTNFYPRPPRGGRLASRHFPLLHTKISIHALREEGDMLAAPRYSYTSNFYPRPPRGGRHCADRSARRAGRISIHALREEGDDFRSAPHDSHSCISIHALREEGDAPRKTRRKTGCKFLSTPSARRATCHFFNPPY